MNKCLKGYSGYCGFNCEYYCPFLGTAIQVDGPVGTDWIDFQAVSIWGGSIDERSMDALKKLNKEKREEEKAKVEAEKKKPVRKKISLKEIRKLEKELGVEGKLNTFPSLDGVLI